MDRSRLSLFKRFGELKNRMCVVISTEKEKKKISTGTYGELMKIKGNYDDLFAAYVEENAALRRKLSEAR